MDERMQRTDSRRDMNNTAKLATTEPRRPKQWLAHAGHGSVAGSEKGPHRRVLQGPGR